MPTFDLVVLGCGGGPNEYNLSSYLLKASQAPWNEGVVAIEAGSGIGALSRILSIKSDLFGQRITSIDDSVAQPHTAAEVLSWIRCYLITHAHMDHINSLVVSAGSLGGRPKRIFAVHQTLKDIESVFSDRLWPNLARWNEAEDAGEAALIYQQLRTDGQYAPVFDGISVCTVPLSHGHTRAGDTYDSSAFFIKHDESNKELLFFGDVEPDSISVHPRNRDVWCAAASKIPHLLSTIFIECSYPTGRSDNLLYGHLSPEHLVRELVTLAEEVIKARRVTSQTRSTDHPPDQPARKKQRINPVAPSDRRNALAGVTVYIIHCKEDFSGQWDRPIHQIIASQVQKMAEGEELGVEIIAAEQGMLIHA